MVAVIAAAAAVVLQRVVRHLPIGSPGTVRCPGAIPEDQRQSGVQHSRSGRPPAT